MFGSLTSLRPRALHNLREELEDMVGRFWNDPRDARWTGEIAVPLDLAETDHAFELRMDLPAVSGKDIDIRVHVNMVTISGERKEDEKEEKGKKWHRVERRTGKFARTVTLPCNVNEDEVAAHFERGVLSVTLPKAKNARPKQVAVNG
jgi:HSP20 family protein